MLPDALLLLKKFHSFFGYLCFQLGCEHLEENKKSFLIHFYVCIDLHKAQHLTGAPCMFTK